MMNKFADVDSVIIILTSALVVLAPMKGIETHGFLAPRFGFSTGVNPIAPSF